MEQNEVDNVSYEAYIDQKINDFQINNNDQKLDPEERQLIISSLINGQKMDLSGVTAIRGFLYQYYVAVAYMVEMFSEDSWWTEVVFELLDDVALVSADKLRFIQVKTVKEDSVDNRLKFYKFYNRSDDGLGWLDKLFLLNTTYLQKEGNLIRNIDQIFESYEVQFEIATNAGYSKQTATYSKNDEFELKDRVEDTLDEKLQVNFSKNITHRGQTFVLDNSLYNKNGRGVDWFLQRLRVNHLGPFVEIEKMIINKLCEYMPQDLGVLQPFVAAIVVQRLLAEIVKATHNDSVSDLSRFIFSREKVWEWIERFQKEGFNLIENEVQTRSLKRKFEQLFQGIRESVNNEWEDDHLRSEIINSTDWVEDEFIRQLDSGNVHVYENFLNKLFNLRYSRAPFPLEGYNDLDHLMKSLKQLVLLFAIYKDRKIHFDESKLLFKQVQEIDDSNWEMFTMYNAQRKDPYDFAVERIKNTMLSCTYSQAKGEDAYCFVTNAKKEESQHRKHWSSMVSITQPEADDRSINAKVMNLKFRPGTLLDKYWVESADEEDYNTLKTEQMFRKWVEYLKNEEE